MTHGFSLDSPLVCEGVIGDGCGGGRFFLVENEMLFAYDPLTKSKIFLAKGIVNAKKITKKGCILTIECQEKVMQFDLSSDIR